jgi:hypothetical protein
LSHHAIIQVSETIDINFANPYTFSNNSREEIDEHELFIQLLDAELKRKN